MRKLTFDHTDRDHVRIFATLYFGFIQGGVNLGKDKNTKPRSEVRLDARILDKLDALCVEDATLPVPWKLVTSGSVLLTNEEYERIDKHLDNVGWPTGSSKDVAKLFDMWGQAEQIAEIVKKEG